ncbi:MAG: helix-turn-helix domain-containing protein [Lachnospiraceae bacterium]
MLKKFMDEKGRTVNEVARYTGIDHSVLYKVLSGARKPSGREMVDRIAYCLRLTERERHEFLRSYFYTILTPEQYCGTEQLIELLSAISAEGSLSPLPVKVESKEDFASGRLLLGADEIRQACLSLAAEQAERKDGQICIFSTGSIGNWFSAIRNLCAACPGVKVTQMVVLDNSGHLTSDNRIFNLDMLCSVFPSVAGCPNWEVRGIYASVNSLESLRFLPKNMLLTSRGTVYFAWDGSGGFLEREPDRISYSCSIFGKLRSTSVPFLERVPAQDFWKNAEETLELAASGKKSDPPTYLFSPGICLTVLFQNREELPGQLQDHFFLPEEVLKHLSEAFYHYSARQQALFASNPESFRILCTKQGIEYFCQTGYVGEVSRKIMKPCSIQERIEVMTRWSAQYEAGSFLLVDIPSLNPSSSATFIAMDSKVTLESAGRDGDVLTANIDEPGIVDLIRWFCGFASSQLTMQGDSAREFFTHCMRELERQKAALQDVTEVVQQAQG